MRSELGNDRGRWIIATTPGTAVVRTSAEPLQVSCALPAGVPGTARLPSGQATPTGNAAAAGAVIGGGLAHTGDAASRRFTYPDVVTVSMVCTSPTPDATSLAASQWGLSVRGASAGDGAPAGAVWVIALFPQGRAAGAGLQVGDLVLAVNGLPLSGTLDLADALGPATAARTAVTLGIRRAGADIQVVLPAEAPR